MSGYELGPKVDAQTQTEESDEGSELQETLDKLQTEVNALKKQNHSL